MKQIQNVLSWASVLTLAIAIASASIYVGASVCNYLHDLFGVQGYWCLALVPVCFIVGTAVTYFFILGLIKFAEGLK